ncbi:MAG: Cellulase [Acidobacteriaceae bacterium]|nr:Cellulase [Acidobacteriaceae bacterium]
MDQQLIQRPLKDGRTRNRLRCGNTMRSMLVLGVTLAACLQGGCKTEPTWPLWEAYTRSAFDPQGRIVDHGAGDRTTSEGQAYGMFFALVANDRVRFDKLVHWTEDNLASGDLTLRLPAWSWGKAPDGTWKTLDQNPASDADLWMAYALLEAGRLWHDPRYEKMGTAMASRIAQQEVALVRSLGATLLPGPQGFHPDAGTWVLNPSYLPPSVLSYMATTFPRGPWGAVLASVPIMLTQGSGNGFAMDWLTAGGSVRPAESPEQRLAGAQESKAVGSYDAIRVYLWLGIADPETPGVQASLAGLGGMAEQLKRHTAPPERVDESGASLSGDGPVGFSAAVVPYLHTLNMRSEEKLQMERMSAMKDPATGLYGRNASYYDQNLVLFANGWLEQRYRMDRQGQLKLKWR